MSDDLQTPAVLKKLQERAARTNGGPGEMNRVGAGDPTPFYPPLERDRLAKLESQISRTVHQELSFQIMEMNYGEFKSYCDGTESNLDKVWDWAVANRRQTAE